VSTPAQKRASAALASRRAAEGLRKSTFWLAEGHRAKIEALKASLGSQDAVVRAALEAYQLPE